MYIYVIFVYSFGNPQAVVEGVFRFLVLLVFIRLLYVSGKEIKRKKRKLKDKVEFW